MSSVNWKNYLENLQQQLDLEAKKYLRNIKMTRDRADRDLFIMELRDSSVHESRVRDGTMLVYPAGQRKVKYLGYIHSVQDDCVTLRFSKKILGFNENMEFDVAFTVYKWTLNCQGQAVTMAGDCPLEKVLFPAAPTIFNERIRLPQLRLFNEQLGKDKEQYQAVQYIVAGTSKPAPYILFGPPGTGTTVTLVEAIQQIEKREENSHILVCASHNNVADHLCQLIVKKVDKNKVLRLYALIVGAKHLPEDLKECSNLRENFHYPSKDELQEYKIIVSTLATSARLVFRKIPKGHFTHIFIDKAEVACETECLIPLAGLLDPKSGQVVLAGDPKQLGPIVSSTVALRKGRGVSLLERLMNNFQQYKENDSRYVTKLLHNYRSHPAILKVPGDLIYNGELQACSDESLALTQVRNSCCNWEHLKTKGFPVIFHAVVGVQEREDNGYSSYNEEEVKKLMYYVKKLLETKSNCIPPSDIGIITPYQKQVQKIRKALRNVGKDLKIANMNCLKVGTVEMFQGQERRVILVSTVCSSQYQTWPNKKFTSDFVKNDKRFNVAVTRAKALLIVVGNPTLWKKGDTWDAFIQYCKDRGGYKDEKE